MTSATLLRQHTPAYRRTMALIALAGLGNFALMYFVQPLLPQLAEYFDVSAGQSGLALSVTTMAILVGLFLAGPISDRLGRVRTMSLSLMVSGALGVLAAFSPTWELFLGVRALTGLALAALPAVAIAYVRESVEPSAHNHANAIYISGTALGGAVARLLPVPLAALGDWHIPAVVLGLFTLTIGILVATMLPRDASAKTPVRISLVLGGALSSLRNRGILLISIVGALNMGMFVSIFNATPFRLSAEPFYLGEAQALMYFAYPVGIAGPALFHALTKKYGRGRSALVGSVLFTTSIVVMAFDSLWNVFIGLGLLTVAMLGAHSVLSGWTVDRAHRAGINAAKASSAYLLLYYAGSTIFGTTATFIWSGFGWSGVTVLGVSLGVSSILCAAIAVVVLRDSPVTDDTGEIDTIVGA